MSYEKKTDSSNQQYIEVPFKGSTGSVRVTYIPNAWPEDNLSGVRIQIREASGHLKPGPEIPRNVFGEFIAALMELVYWRDRE